MKEIFCHIVGLNNKLKIQVTNILIKKNFEIINLDDVTQTIIKSKHLNDLYYDYEITLQNSKLNKNLTSKCKILEKEMNEIWKNNFTNILESKINNIQKNIVLIGYSNHFKNVRFNVKINTKLKFFFKLNLIKNAKNIIANNLDQHRNEIINGTFPLEFLQIDYLIKKRYNMINIYKKNGYELKNILSIIKIINNNINFDINLLGDIYYASLNKINSKIKYDNTSFVGYTIPWLAAVSCLKSKKLQKGFKNNNGFVKQIQKGGINDLKTNCFIYKVNKDDFYQNDKGKNIKLKSSNNLKILENYYIENIYKYLIDNDIKILY